MAELWFVAGVALGTIVTGFAAIGSFGRGSDSARRNAWSREQTLRQRALTARAAVGPHAQPNAAEALSNAS